MNTESMIATPAIEKLQSLLDKCIEIKNQKKATPFVSYFGHVDLVTVHFHIPEWFANTAPSAKFEFYIDSEQAEEKLQEVYTYIENLLNS